MLGLCLGQVLDAQRSVYAVDVPVLVPEEDTLPKGGLNIARD